MNVLSTWMQNRVLEHLHRLKTYVEVRGKVVALCQTAGGGEEADCAQLEEQDWHGKTQMPEPWQTMFATTVEAQGA